MTVEMLGHAPLELGEGPRWDAAGQRLLLVDILGGHILSRRHGADVFTTTRVDGHVGAVAPVAGDPGRVLAAVDHGVALVDLAGGAMRWLAEPERDRRGAVRMNDGACDPQGRFVVGTVAYDEAPGAGCLWRIDGTGAVERLLDTCTVPNGLVWSADGAALLHIDSGHRTITRYRYGDHGVSDPQVVYRAPDGPAVPDGMCADTDGTLWVAFHGGACVRHMTTGGTVLDTVALPMTLTTACAFAGPDLDHLVVTSARQGLDPAMPDDGRSAVLRPGARGLPATPFALRAPANGA